MQYTNIIWRDGQPYSEMFDDIYHSSNEDEAISGESEFNYVFLKNNGLPERWHNTKDKFVIAELGFGSGLNCLLTIRQWLNHLDECGENKCLHYVALEKYPLSPNTIVELVSKYPELKKYCDELIKVYPPAVSGTHTRHLFDNRVVIHYKFLDASEALNNERYNIDAWYLDGFSPAKNPKMWSETLFEKIANNSHSDTTCSTYTSAGFVKRNLQKVGFEVSKIAGFGKKREMLIAKFNGSHNKTYKFTDKPWFLSSEQPSVETKKATVIGAGIAGLCVAYSLVKRGWRVTIIDKHSDVANEASSNPAAIIYPRLSINSDVDTEFYSTAYCYALYILTMLQNKYSEEFWFNSGLLQSMDKNRSSEILKKFSFNKTFVTKDITSEEKNTLAFIEANNELISYPSAGVVIPKLLCDILVKECGEKLNIIHAEINDIKYRSNTTWQCFNNETFIHESDVLVIANGCGVNECGLDLTLPVECVRGQVAVLHSNIDSNKLRSVVNSEVYITPAINQKHYLGATYSRTNSDAEQDENDNKSLIKTLDKLYPGMFDVKSIAHSWVGFRSMSADRIAIVGAVPNKVFFNDEYKDICHGRKNKTYLPAEHLNGLYVSIAHGSRGFTSSFLCGEMIAAKIAGEPATVSKEVMDYLQPSRFIVNDLKQR